MKRCQVLIYALVGVMSVLVRIANAGEICSLCGTVYDLPKRWDHQVDSSRKTCRDIFFEVGYLSLQHPSCDSKRKLYQSVCCDDNLPAGSYISPTPPPVSTQYGEEPQCSICLNGGYPGRPSAFIAARYVGHYSCGQLYQRGNNGLIPGFMCGPLQDYANDVCQCGQNNVNVANHAPEPVTSPPVTTKPSAAPFAPPSTSPSSKPSVDPTKEPTIAPGIFDRKTAAPGSLNRAEELKLSGGRDKASLPNTGQRGLKKSMSIDTPSFQD